MINILADLKPAVMMMNDFTVTAETSTAIDTKHVLFILSPVLMLFAGIEEDEVKQSSEPVKRIRRLLRRLYHEFASDL